MRLLSIRNISLLIITIYITSCSASKKNDHYVYHPGDQKLYDTIVHLDSMLFAAYNTCNVNLPVFASYFSEDIEFYHDRGGLMTSKKDIIDATERNICGKVTRELIKGSIEVYPINNYGAIEMGLERFHNLSLIHI